MRDEKHLEFIDDMKYFLEKNTLKSLQQAQILLNAEVTYRLVEENKANVFENILVQKYGESN